MGNVFNKWEEVHAVDGGSGRAGWVGNRACISAQGDGLGGQPHTSTLALALAFFIVALDRMAGLAITRAYLYNTNVY